MAAAASAALKLSHLSGQPLSLAGRVILYDGMLSVTEVLVASSTPTLCSGSLVTGQTWHQEVCHIDGGQQNDSLFAAGVCNLCNSGVQFVAKRDPDKNIMFCSVQSHAADAYLQGIGLTRQEVLQRFVFVEYNQWSSGSTAALRVAGYMKYPWPLAKSLLLVPEPLRDAVYDFVAANRYRWFGRTAHCHIPDSSIIDRFVDRDELLAGVCRDEGMNEDMGNDDKREPPNS